MNEVALSNDLNTLAAEINSYKNLAGHSFVEIGRRLLHINKENLTYGDWEPFLESIQMSNSQARRFMTVANEYNLGKLPDVGQIGLSAMYEIATLPEKNREEAINEDGSVKTVREIRELKRQNKEKEEIIKTLQNEATEVIEKEVVKEVKVTPHDYHGLKSDNKQLSQALKEEQQENQKMRNQLNQWMQEREETDKKSKRYDELSEAIKKMEGKMDAGQKRISTVKNVTEKLKIGNQLIDELSGLIYLTDYEELSRNEFLSDEINKLMYRLNSYMSDFTERLDQTTILEGEIIND